MEDAKRKVTEAEGQLEAAERRLADKKVEDGWVKPDEPKDAEKPSEASEQEQDVEQPEESEEADEPTEDDK